MSLNIKSSLFIALLVVTAVVFIRWFSLGQDISTFIVAGSQFVNESSHESIVINEGPGYDGQFFYRYSLDPSGSVDKGIEVDHPAYRHQRIIYPVIVWILSFGIDSLVPFNMVLVNIIALLFSCFFLEKILGKLNYPKIWALTPLLLSGVWMGLGRNLAEVLELFFLCALLYQIHLKNYWLISLFTVLCLFNRESTALIILPASLSLAWMIFRVDKLKTTAIFNYLLLFIPYGLVFLWKIFLFKFHGSETLVEGGGNLTFPFLGIYHSLVLVTKNVSSLIDWVELGIWIFHFTWNIWLALICYKLLFVKSEKIPLYLIWMWVSGFFFALLFSNSIYSDDWSFARVLTGFNFISFLVIFYSGERPSKLFLLYTFALTVTTLGRLWIRV